MKHKNKLKLARRMESKHRKGYSVFVSPQWESRKSGIANRVRKAQAIAHARALEKKAKLKKELPL